MFSLLADLQKERGFPHPSRKKKLLKLKRESTCFLLTAWIFLPDAAARGHAIIFPRFPVTISRVMESIKEKPQSL